MEHTAVSVNISSRVDQWLDKSWKYTFMERIELLRESEPLFCDESYSVRYGHTLQYILERLSLPFLDGELLVGGVDERIPTDAEWEETESLYKSWWDDKPLEQIQKDISWYYSKAWLRCRPPWFNSFGHLALDWPMLVREGILGFKNLARESLKGQMEGTDSDFLNGALISLDAISAYFRRYARAAAQDGRMGDGESLEYLSENPPRNFKEALQLIWLVSLVLQKVCGCGVLNFSRMDQYLLPLYRRETREGTLDRDGALALLHDFYIRNNEVMSNTDHMSLDTDSTTQTLEVAFDDPNYIILGGLLSKGTSGVNELSELMVLAASHLRLKNPFIVLRWHEGIDEGFFLRVCTAMRDNTSIIIYNDEKMIPALRRSGVMEPEIYDYGFFGCNDPIIPAMEGGLRQLWFNLVKPLELALNQGDFPMEPGGRNRDPYVFPLLDRMVGLMTGAYYGMKTPPVDCMKSMSDVLEAYREQVEFLAQKYREGIEHDMTVEAEANKGRLRIEDCFLQGTLRNAVTWNNGGTEYHHIVVQGSGLATVADALYAIDNLVFIKREMTLPELNEILINNWEGQEALRQRVRHLPKYGNDLDEADRYAAWVTGVFTDALSRQDGGRYLYSFFPTLSTDRDFTTMGLTVGATADGRRRRDPISENQSPAEGADVSGLTALLNSAAKIPFDRITGGPLNIRIHPSAVSGQNGAKMLAALMKTYMQKGGLQLQVNVVDRETLLKATEEPEKFKNLCVRVVGYSAFFTQMGPKAQDELIRRTEQLT